MPASFMLLFCLYRQSMADRLDTSCDKIVLEFFSLRVFTIMNTILDLQAMNFFFKIIIELFCFNSRIAFES